VHEETLRGKFYWFRGIVRPVAGPEQEWSRGFGSQGLSRLPKAVMVDSDDMGLWLPEFDSGVRSVVEGFDRDNLSDQPAPG
jgi:hypothetical protein